MSGKKIFNQNEIRDKKLNTIREMYSKGILRNRLTKFTINSFRKFMPDTQINFNFPLTVFTGKNGSGKTSIMKMIALLSGKAKPQYEFFETDLDDAGLINAGFEFVLDDYKFGYRRIGKNKWGLEGSNIPNIPFIWIKPKTMIGAIDKSLLYDSVSNKENRELKTEYIIKQSSKIKQNTLEKSQKKAMEYLSEQEIAEVNMILQKNYVDIKIIKHRYFNGTWGTTVIFNDGTSYSEYNAGSGEFLIANIVKVTSKMPKGSLILLDEPEISLHPGAQKRLIDYILTIIIKKQVQFVISTHSTYIISQLPKECLKCFRIFEDESIRVEENVLEENVFLELEADIIGIKHIIVEDKLAKELILSIFKEENMQDLCIVDYYPGGADNLKVTIIPVFSKVGINDRYIFFDGDQFKMDVPDYSRVPECEKTIQYYRDQFHGITGNQAKNVKWGVDANRNEGRKNEEQEIKLIQNYLEYYSRNVFFLPLIIPEDIIFNAEYIKKLFYTFDYECLEDKMTGKEKIKCVSDKTGIDVKTIEKMLIYNFVSSKDENYMDILAKLKNILK